MADRARSLHSAPVLLVDDVIDAPLTDHLFAAFADGDPAASGMPTTSGELAVVPEAKIRADLILEGELLERTAAALQRHLLPAVRHAYSFAATQFEQIKMVRYPVGGHFAAHRDNDAPDCAHRRFAVTINLDVDYDGGELRFTEFTGAPVRPSAGGAVVFSCSFEHEVLAITRGKRHALITFLS